MVEPAEILEYSDYALRKKLLKKYPASILDLLATHSLGRKSRLPVSNFKAARWQMCKSLQKKGNSGPDLPGLAKRASKTF